MVVMMKGEDTLPCMNLCPLAATRPWCHVSVAPAEYHNCQNVPNAGTCLRVLEHIPGTHTASLDMVVSKVHTPPASHMAKT